MALSTATCLRRLLFGEFKDAKFGVISHVLRRTFTCWRFVQIVAPDFTADGGALKYAVFSAGLSTHQSIRFYAQRSWFYTSARYLACLCTPAGGGRRLHEGAGDGKGCKESWLSNQLYVHKKFSLIDIK